MYVFSLLALLVLRTSAVQRSVELRAQGGAAPRSGFEGTPAYPVADQPSVAGVEQPGQPYFPPAFQQGVPSVQGTDDSFCGAPVSLQDMEKPISTVKSANGDLYCHFASTASWLKECHDARKEKDYVTYAKMKGTEYVQQVSAGVSPIRPGPPDPMPILYAGGSKRLVTQLLAWPLEDVYCDALGWMDTPTTVVSNHTMLEQVARVECDRLYLEHPEFLQTSMKELITLMNANHIQILQSANRKGPGPTVSDMKRHAISRCLLGGLECDIANCALNFCHRDDLGFDFVGHGFTQCSATKFVD